MKKLFCLFLAALLALTALAFAEDTQNPAMNLIGEYADEVGQRATLTIECEGADGAKAVIRWANSAFETVEWVFSGVCDANDLSVAYENCVKTVLTYAEDGTETAETVYENGTGKLIVDAETYKIAWQDDMENAGADCVFSFVPVAEPDFPVPMGAAEEELLAALGAPAEEKPIEDGKILYYEGFEVAGLTVNARLILENDVLVAADFVNTDCGDEGRAALSELALSFGEPANLDDAVIADYALNFTALENADTLTYAAAYAADGTLVIYLRSAQDGAELLLLTPAAQF